MILIHISVILIIVFANFCIGYPTVDSLEKDEKFQQSILAVGVPYYKLLMVLGTCNKTLLFKEEKAWGKVRYNRVLDIYYKSQNPDILVSKVEIIVVLDNTDCSVYSRNGIGHAEFSATMFIPTRVSMIFYRLIIWTCSDATNEDGRQFEMEVNSKEKQEDIIINKLPFYDRPLRPDIGPHHIYYDSDPVIFVHPNKYDTKIIKQKIGKKNSTTTLPLQFLDVAPEI